MSTSIREILDMVRSMDMENKFLKMDLNIQGSILMIKEMAKGPMKIIRLNMKVNGKMVNETDKENYF